jgi:hypothetical protein
MESPLNRECNGLIISKTKRRRIIHNVNVIIKLIIGASNNKLNNSNKTSKLIEIDKMEV